ncbi:MAG: multidrug ABC transporter substrate-binding protein [Acidobacteria bacterium]|nr:MAG: multidrug ABC transporter substrate-binding protein [Acidobacteriota bacterium]PYU68534.1 MAG: multidrug ABC transporter substrate-binding protein [Acidobacteriota bacterium]
MHRFLNQLKQVFRRLSHAPLFTAITLITLAAGVGGNTVVFSVLESVLLKPLPYPRAAELIGVWHTAPGINITDLNMAPSNYFIYREQNQTFQDIGAYETTRVNLTGLAEAERLDALNVTDGTLPLLGIPPLLGRTFTHQDDSPGSPDTVILTYGFWRKKFAGSPSAIGQTIILDGTPRQIIGVLPPRFQFLDETDLAVILPFKWDRNTTHLGNFSYEALARLKPAVTIKQANADIARMLPLVTRTFPAPPGFSAKLFDDARIGPNLRPLKNDVVGDVGSMLWVVMGSIGLVLLIACANVANLLLVRVEGRRQELAVRSALGAGPYRIAAELFLESVILGLLGSAVGLGLAYAALRVLVAIAPASIPRINEIGIDGPVLLFTFAIAILASIFFGSIPVFKYAGVRLSTGIREGGRANSQSREQHRVRSVLVVVQVALALVLLVCSGLMIRTFRALNHVNPGFSDPASMQTFGISLPDNQVKDDESVVRTFEEMRSKISSIPGVSAVTLSTAFPMDGRSSADVLFAEDHPLPEGQIPPIRRMIYVIPGFFSADGTPLVAGRDFTWTDLYQKLPVAIISENFAREYWDSPSAALGKRIRIASTDDWREIIGVAANVYMDGVNKKTPSTVYWPTLRVNFEGEKHSVASYIVFGIRSSRAGTESFLKEVREAVWTVNRNLPLSRVNTLGYYYRQSMARTSFTLIMLAVAGAMALLLGVGGIYGVIAYSVSQRTREIGVRMALGAQTQSLTAMFVRHGLILTGIGIAFGLTAASIVMRLMSSLLFRVNPVDPLTYAAVTLGLIATAFIASYLPSRRAATVDPVDALRAE